MTWNEDHGRHPQTDLWEPVDKSDQEFRGRLAAEIGFEASPDPAPAESEERRSRELAYIHANHHRRSTDRSRADGWLRSHTRLSIGLFSGLLGIGLMALGEMPMEWAVITVLLALSGVSALIAVLCFFFSDQVKVQSGDGKEAPHDASHTPGDP